MVYTRALPYGRIGSCDLVDVLIESKGTCSTKHALIASLARECDSPIE